MYVSRLIAVVAGSQRPGRCKYCGSRIVWAIRASRSGFPAKGLPFEAQPVPLRREADPETGVLFEYWPRSALHLATCPNRPIWPRPRVDSEVTPC